MDYVVDYTNSPIYNVNVSYIEEFSKTNNQCAKSFRNVIVSFNPKRNIVKYNKKYEDLSKQLTSIIANKLYEKFKIRSYNNQKYDYSVKKFSIETMTVRMTLYCNDENLLDDYYKIVSDKFFMEECLRELDEEIKEAWDNSGIEIFNFCWFDKSKNEKQFKQFIDELEGEYGTNIWVMEYRHGLANFDVVMWKPETKASSIVNFYAFKFLVPIDYIYHIVNEDILTSVNQKPCYVGYGKI